VLQAIQEGPSFTRPDVQLQRVRRRSNYGGAGSKVWPRGKQWLLVVLYFYGDAHPWMDAALEVVLAF
jgi:hypothetical protein